MGEEEDGGMGGDERRIFGGGKRKMPTYIFPMVPENLIHISQCRNLRHHRLHPVDHPRLIIRTPLPPSARRRQLRHPNLLVRPRVVQARDLIDRALRIHAVHMRRNNVDLVHAAIARFGKVGEVGAAGKGHGGGDPLGRGLGVDERREGVRGVRGPGEGGQTAVGEVGFVEEFEVGRGVGASDHFGSGGHVGGVHANVDLGCV